MSSCLPLGSLSPSELVSASLVLYKTDPIYVYNIVKSFRQSYRAGTLYVIDNSPRKFQIYHFKDPGTVYIKNRRNLGFGVAHNHALKRSRNEGFSHHLLINPDVSFDSTTVDLLYHHMQSNPTVGAVMPRVVYPDGELQRLCKLYPSPWDSLLRLVPWYEKLFPRRTGQYEMHSFDYDQVFRVPLISGCFMMINNKVQETGIAFDTKYFMYYEDYDLCRRIRQAGYEISFEPAAEIIHDHNRESRRNPVLFYRHAHSALRYFTKWGWFKDPERKKVNAGFIQRARSGEESLLKSAALSTLFIPQQYHEPKGN